MGKEILKMKPNYNVVTTTYVLACNFQNRFQYALRV